MRLPLLSSCLIPLMLISCSTVRVMPERPGNGHATAPGELPPMVRGDRARTQDFPPAEGEGYRPPARLAVLLPMTGSLAPAAAGVRDGFLAAYYAENRSKPVVKFYDSQGTGSGAQAAMAKAIAEGAQMIVGPLTRDEVSAVLAQDNGGLPMITLNRGNKLPPVGSTSFALLPDEEGAAAANRLADRGVTSVLIFSNKGDSAQRSVLAFRDALQKRGGKVTSEIAVGADVGDMHVQLDEMLVGPTPPKAVFLALDAAQARAIAAQLKASALSGLPRIASSQILSGSNARADIELDGIEYPELPWLLNESGGLPEPAALAKSLPGARGAAQRLFAFGADAWKLAAYFERLYNDPSYSIRGATGILRIDVSGPVQRIPSWAVFSGGHGKASPDAGRAADDPSNAH
jgi:outer membrane PBP1 activator LpoA protein